MFTSEIALNRLQALRTVDTFPFTRTLDTRASNAEQVRLRSIHMRWMDREGDSIFFVSRELDLPTNEEVFLLRTMHPENNPLLVRGLAEVLGEPLPARPTILPGSSTVTRWPANRLEQAMQAQR